MKPKFGGYCIISLHHTEAGTSILMFYAKLFFPGVLHHKILYYKCNIFCSCPKVRKSSQLAGWNTSQDDAQAVNLYWSVCIVS